MLGPFDRFFGSKTKVYEIGDHRVKAYSVKIPGTEAYGDLRGVTARRKTRYRCIDCDKSRSSRTDFENLECHPIDYVYE